MMQAIIEGTHKTMNQFSLANGVSDIMSPLTIMTGRPSLDYNNPIIELSAYSVRMPLYSRTMTPPTPQKHGPLAPLR